MHSTVIWCPKNKAIFYVDGFLNRASIPQIFSQLTPFFGMSKSLGSISVNFMADLRLSKGHISLVEKFYMKRTRQKY